MKRPSTPRRTAWLPRRAQSLARSVADGISGRVARLRAIGNTVVPQCVIDGPFRVIAEREALLATEAA